ncbi:hypothetical protein [Lacticaseibacillus kribbianus]|uniref:hypothetical protein n=1 Tax=Lacticaseibacillus kribbianus TaxID=2926292 RepID=UPI001CD7B574|nr:hypothetical protein [Lacticaseibacillus kribbianus]
MEPTASVSRLQKTEGADLIMDQGFLTEREEPAMMDAAWCHELLPQINDEMRLRTLDNRVVLKLFHYYSGEGSIIYDPSKLSEARAKTVLMHALGYHK